MSNEIEQQSTYVNVQQLLVEMQYQQSEMQLQMQHLNGKIQQQHVEMQQQHTEIQQQKIEMQQQQAKMQHMMVEMQQQQEEMQQLIQQQELEIQLLKNEKEIQNQQLQEELDQQIKEVFLADNQQLEDENMKSTKLYLEAMNQLKSELHDYHLSSDRHDGLITNKVEDLNDRLKVLETEIMSFKSEWRNLVNRLTENEVKHNDTIVTFTAYATEDRNFQANATLYFDGVIINEGGFYNPDLSVFTCPFTGHYMVSSSLLSLGTDFARGEIIAGGDVVASLYAKDANGPTSASSTVVVQCEQGNVIYVRAYDGTCNINGDVTRPYTTFSVTLLSKSSDIN